MSLLVNYVKITIMSLTFIKKVIFKLMIASSPLKTNAANEKKR